MTHTRKIAKVVGAGAVENAWAPILDSLKLLQYGDVDEDSANFIFAKVIYNLRIYSNYTNELSKSNLKMELENFKFLKEFMSKRIKEAQQNKTIKVRKEFDELLKTFVFNQPNSSFGIISTNWDTTINDKADEIVRRVFLDLDNASCFQIHGSIINPENLYLPSEISLENYRSEDENNSFGYNIFSTLEFLNKAELILLYGISLSPLDAELCQILNAVFSSNSVLKEVKIINPDYKRVKSRINILIPKGNDIKIKCYHPENLNLEK